MVMYKKFLNNFMNFSIMDSKSSENGLFMGGFDQSVTKYSECLGDNLALEKCSSRMKALFLFCKTLEDTTTISVICDNLDIEYKCSSNIEEPLRKEISDNVYDLIVVYCHSFSNKHLDIIMKILSEVRDLKSVKVVAYTSKKLEEYDQIWTYGFNEVWFSYKSTFAMHNYLKAFINNQFKMKLILKKALVTQTVFDNFIDSIEILDSEYRIKMTNQTRDNYFNKMNMNDEGNDWFEVHNITSSMKDVILSAMYYNGYWEGMITHVNNSSLDAVNMYLAMKRLIYDGLIIVSINTNASIINSRDNSYSILSRDNDAVSSISRAFQTESVTKDFYGSLSIDSPILMILKIINGIQDLSSPVVRQSLQKIVDILASKDLFDTTVGAHKYDKVSTNLIDGLLSNSSTIFNQTEIRRQSNAIMKIIKRKKSKVNKVPNIPENEETNAIDTLLESYYRWDFDILALEKLTEFKPLRYIGMKIFQKFEMGRILNIDSQLFQNWLNIIESNYNESNPYHNSTHAADVLQSSVYFLERPYINEIFDNMDDTATIIAAIIHDLGHPGRTNPFLINSHHSLAVMYNDLAVLENHHVSFAFKISLKDDRINIFKNLNPDDYRYIRHSIIDTVLATEMAKHFEHLTKFVSNILKHTTQGNDYLKTEDTLTELTEPLNLNSPENKALIRRILIKCSDVNNPTRPFRMCEEWAKRISEEYFNQTDEEIAKNLPVVMPHFNRKTCDIPKVQISFIELFLEDMFTSWCKFIQCNEPLQILMENKSRWSELAVEETVES